MADGKGIRRLVQIVLDKASRTKIKREIGDALDKGTDPKKAKRNLKSIEGGLGMLRKAALRLGGALVAALGVRALFRFGKAAVQTAADAEAIWNRLGQAVENTGRSFASIRPEFEKFAREVQDLTTVGDEDLAEVLTELITITNDYELSVENIIGVLDLAAAKQIDLTTAAQLYGRALIGDTGTLSRYGIIVQEGADAIAILRERFAGFAVNEAQGQAGMVKQLVNEWGDFKQVLGEVFTGASGGDGILRSLTLTVKELTGWVEENKIVWQQYFDTFWSGISGAASAMKNILDVLDPLGKKIRDITQGVLALREDELALAAERFRLGQEILALNKKSQEEALKARLFEGAPKRAAEENVEVLEREINAIQRIIIMIDELIEARARAAAAGGGGGGAGGGGFLTGGARPASERVGTMFGDPAEDMFSRFREGFDTSRAVFGFEAKQGFQEIGDGFDELRARATEAAGGMELALVTAAYGITDAFAEGFEIMASGMSSLPEAAKRIGLGIVAGLSGGMAQYHTAQGIGKLAEGSWPPNPLALFSSAKHFLAAAAFKALGALTRKSGTSSRGASSGGTNTGRQSAVGGEGRVGTSVNIFIDPIDPDNPLHRRVIGRASQLAREQWGDSIPISVKPWTGSTGP